MWIKGIYPHVIHKMFISVEWTYVLSTAVVLYKIAIFVEKILFLSCVKKIDVNSETAIE